MLAGCVFGRQLGTTRTHVHQLLSDRAITDTQISLIVERSFSYRIYGQMLKLCGCN